MVLHAKTAAQQAGSLYQKGKTDAKRVFTQLQ
jgi:hypothetical protein